MSRAGRSNLLALVFAAGIAIGVATYYWHMTRLAVREPEAEHAMIFVVVFVGGVAIGIGVSIVVRKIFAKRTK